MNPTNDITYDKDTHELCVCMGSLDPNIKGVRAKGQKFLKLNGVYDGTLWYRRTESDVCSSKVYFKLTSPSLYLMEAFAIDRITL